MQYPCKQPPNLLIFDVANAVYSCKQPPNLLIFDVANAAYSSRKPMMQNYVITGAPLPHQAAHHQVPGKFCDKIDDDVMKFILE